MKRLSLLALAGALALAGCTTDEIDLPIFGDAGPIDVDMNTGGGAVGPCPEGADTPPDPEGISLPCCARSSNADRLGDVQLRLTSVRFTAPDSVNPDTAGPLTNSLLQQAIDQERFNWTLRIQDDGGAVTVQAGGGIRQDGGALAFANGNATTPMGDNPLLADPSRWDPSTTPGEYTGNTFMQTEPAGFTSVPVFNVEGNVLLEFPLQSTSFTLELDDTRTCAGVRRNDFSGIKFEAAGTLETFTRVEDTVGFEVNQPPLPPGTQLCAILGQFGPPLGLTSPCDPNERSAWGVLPDSVCDETGCTLGGCDGMTTCNAWRVAANISAAAYDIQ